MNRDGLLYHLPAGRPKSTRMGVLQSRYVYEIVDMSSEQYSFEKWLGAKGMTLGEILDAREARSERQRHLLSRFPATLVSMTLNIPGPIKSFPLADWFFCVACAMAQTLFCHRRETVLHMQSHRLSTGNEAFFCVDRDATTLKEALVGLEESAPAARLLDLDVFDADGRQITRAELGLSPRRCHLCARPAVECARSRRHSMPDLLLHTVKLLQDHRNNAYADAIAAAACRAMLYEVAVTPKPGLVDRDNNGAHEDMTFFSFMDSVSVLTPYFRNCSLAGLENPDRSPERLFAGLRFPGMAAEDAMRRATGGVNTHKGAIFSLGVLCAAAGRLLAGSQDPSAENLAELSARMVRDGVAADLELLKTRAAATNGEKIYSGTGVKGARGEVAAGFPCVLGVGLPALARALSHGATHDEAGAYALLHLLAHVCDTNVISRSTFERHNSIKDDISSKLDRVHHGDFREIIEIARQIDGDFIREHISPGGSADLLSVSFMFLFLTSPDFTSHISLGHSPFARMSALPVDASDA